MTSKQKFWMKAHQFDLDSESKEIVNQRKVCASVMSIFDRAFCLAFLSFCFIGSTSVFALPLWLKESRSADVLPTTF